MTENAMGYNKDYRAQYDKVERGGYLKDGADTRTVRQESVNSKKVKQPLQPHNYSQYGHGTYRQESPTNIHRPAEESAPATNKWAMFFALFLDKKEYRLPLIMFVLAWVLDWQWLYALGGLTLALKTLMTLNLVTFVISARLVRARVVSNDSASSKGLVTTIYEFQTSKGLERASFRSADKRAFDSEVEPVVYNISNPQHILCVDVLPALVQDYIYRTKKSEG